MSSKLPRWLKSLFSGVALFGWAAALIKPSLWLIGLMGDIDFVAANFEKIGHFLETGWGTFTTVGLGALLIAYSAWRGGAQETHIGSTSQPSHTLKAGGVQSNRELRVLDFEPPNFAIWRNLETATIFEIARLCVGEEPHSTPMSGRQKPFENLIFEGVTKGKIGRADKKKRQIRAITEDGEAEYEEYYAELNQASVVYIKDVEKYFSELNMMTDFFKQSI